MKSISAKLGIVIFLTILGITFGCQKDKDVSCNCNNTINSTCVIYEQTYCADPWGQDNEDDEKLIKNLEEYFDNLGVTMYDIGIVENGTREVCLACHCKSGKRFCAKVNNIDLEKVKDHGFIEK